MKVKGSYTVEATFIMCIVISCIFLLLTTGIFLYNSSILRQQAYIAAFRGSLLNTDNETVMNETKEAAKDLTKENQIFIKQNEIEVTVSFQEVVVDINAQMTSFVFELWKEFFPNSLDQIKVSGKANRIRQKLFIRTVRKVETLVKQQLDKENEPRSE